MAKKKQKRAAKAHRNRAMPPLEVLKSAELLTVEQFSALEPAFSVGTIRWALFNRGSNGLAASGAVAQLGRRVLIRPAKFRDWIVSQAPAAA